MPKRKHEDAAGDLDDTLPSEAVSKKKKWAPEVANELEENGAPAKIEYWIVRKPKNIKTNDLPIFRFPKRLPAKDKAVLRTDRENEYINVKFSEVSKQMFYINRENAITLSSGKKRVHPTAEIKGMMFMQPEDADTYVGPIPPEEDFLNPENCTEPADLPYEIPAIRRRPTTGKYEPLERVKAFGSGLRKKRSKKKKN
uniref:Uncharacterized protein n=1 Tax=Panagrolaimus superbus TaxID=310955 RepID=A0A914Y9K8_9BILA